MSDSMAAKPHRPDWLALGAAMVTVVFWGSAFVGIRAIAADFQPGALALGRVVIGSAALGVVVAFRRPPLPTGRAWVFIMASGVLWLALYSIALNAAEREIDAGTAAMLVSTGPILIAVFGGLFLKEGFPLRLFGGCAVALAGAATIGWATSAGEFGADGAMWPIALCLFAALVYAAGVTLQKPALATTSPLMVTWLACVVGAVTCLPFAPQLAGELGAASDSAIAWLLFLGLFPTALAFTTWAFALSRTTAGRLGALAYLVPVTAIGLGWLVMGEVAPPLALAGGAICVLGVVVARWTPRARTRVRSDNAGA